jgi:hypothetical protein
VSNSHATVKCGWHLDSAAETEKVRRLDLWVRRRRAERLLEGGRCADLRVEVGGWPGTVGGGAAVAVAGGRGGPMPDCRASAPALGSMLANAFATPLRDELGPSEAWDRVEPESGSMVVVVELVAALVAVVLIVTMLMRAQGGGPGGMR